MPKFHHIRETRAWQEEFEKGVEEGKTRVRQKYAPILKAKGYTLKENAEFLEISLSEARRLASK